MEKNFFGFNKPFELAQFSPIFFKGINQRGNSISVFQTVSIRDFDICFSEESLHKFCQENGVLIAHTYFAYLGTNHEGRLFENKNGKFRTRAKEGFERLGRLIKQEAIWNPTISELKNYFNEFEQIEYVFHNDDIQIVNFKGIKKNIG